tara:strand:+ start:185 stop:403 length:219 start_codon:yes stop_codon:yes gene_type:complete
MRMVLEHLGTETAPTLLEQQEHTNPQLPSGGYQCVPVLIVEACQKQALDRITTRHQPAQEACREHPGVVDNE